MRNPLPSLQDMVSRLARMAKRKSGLVAFVGIVGISLILFSLRGSKERTTKSSVENINNIVNFEERNENYENIKENNNNVMLTSETMNVELKILNEKEKYQAKELERCDLEWRRDIFTENNDGYETMAFSHSEIHAKDFTFKREKSTPNPIVNNPVIRLDPNRFMLPVLIRGPNNQLVGLRESIYVTIRLNRTLVIPRFMKHRTDDQRKAEQTIHPGHRVDFQTVCQFVSCISLQQYREACGRRTDVIFRLRHYSKKRITDLESLTGTLFSFDPETDNINLLPNEQNKNKATIFKSSGKEIRKLFGTSAKCAIYGQPFYNMKIKAKHSGHHVEKSEDLDKVRDAELFSEVIRRSLAPKYIQDLAANFIHAAFKGEDFLSVHWRYDKQDWMKRCNNTETSKGRLKLCGEALLIEPQDVAEAIFSKLEQVAKRRKLTQVYIASPPSQEDFLSKVSKLLLEKRIISSSLKDLSQFINDRYQACDFIESNFNDILSTMEMQICARSTVFMRSTHSSWSSNVIEQRRADAISGTLPKQDEDILNLTNKQRLQRLQSK